jgi:hypothetical protein
MPLFMCVKKPMYFSVAVIVRLEAIPLPAVATALTRNQALIIIIVLDKAE